MVLFWGVSQLLLDAVLYQKLESGELVRPKIKLCCISESQNILFVIQYRAGNMMV